MYKHQQLKSDSNTSNSINISSRSEFIISSGNLSIANLYTTKRNLIDNPSSGISKIAAATGNWKVVINNAELEYDIPFRATSVYAAHEPREQKEVRKEHHTVKINCGYCLILDEAKLPHSKKEAQDLKDTAIQSVALSEEELRTVIDKSPSVILEHSTLKPDDKILIKMRELEKEANFARLSHPKAPLTKSCGSFSDGIILKTAHGDGTFNIEIGFNDKNEAVSVSIDFETVHTNLNLETNRLLETISSATQHLARIDAARNHQEYQKLLDLGKDAIPIFLDKLTEYLVSESNNPHYVHCCICALEDLSGQTTDLPNEDKGIVDKRVNYWINWAKKNQS